MLMDEEELKRAKNSNERLVHVYFSFRQVVDPGRCEGFMDVVTGGSSPGFVTCNADACFGVARRVRTVYIYTYAVLACRIRVSEPPTPRVRCVPSKARVVLYKRTSNCRRAIDVLHER